MNSVKYLGILLDKHLQWSKQLGQAQVKLNCRIEISCKLRHNTNLQTLKIVHHSLFVSHFQHDVQLWGQVNKESQNKIHVIQNRALRKISFKKLQDSTAQLCKDLKLLKFSDTVHFQNCKNCEQNENLPNHFQN